MEYPTGECKSCDALAARVAELEAWMKTANRAGHLAAAFEVIEGLKAERDRYRSALGASQEALISMHADSAWMREQVAAGKCLECAEAIDRWEPRLGLYYRALHINHELLSR